LAVAAGLGQERSEPLRRLGRNLVRGDELLQQRGGVRQPAASRDKSLGEHLLRECRKR
jgi:hypothetical protein